MRYKICMRCYAVVGRGKKSCPSCNTLLSPAMVARVKLCRRDGTPVPIDGHFCSTCGSQVNNRYMPWWGWLSLFALISIIVMTPLYNLHQYVYTTYQQETCEITAESIDSTTSKSSTTYHPELTYIVLGNGGQQLASGNGEMGLADSSDQDGVQQELNQYQIGSSYTCWYSSIASPEAALVQPDVIASGVGEISVWLFGTFLLLYILKAIITRCFVYSRGLYKRTVQVMGTVVSHEQRKTKSSSYTMSIIEYQTKTEPSLRCRTEQRGTQPLGSSHYLCYDWLYPVQNHKIRENYAKSSLTSAMLLGSVWILSIAGLGGVFFVWMAFQF